ncbi:MAG: imidazolonepropionase [Lachnospiraceae bacterium]|nr:imidazolonepropionase [Ruminococcus sp.]MCM1274291.1 imidazolonepropionase [Lachnospiraceae bacterium]
MPRSYKHIKQYEKEIEEMLERGYTHRGIGEELGFSKEQVKGFVKRKHANQRKIEAGNPPRKKGRPPKDDKYIGTDKVSELKYLPARKEAQIKQLEMENELMRDFLSLTGRK